MNKKIVENNNENMLDSDSGISLNDFFASYGVKPRYIVADKTKEKGEDSIPWGKKEGLNWTKQEALDKLEQIKGILDTDFLNRHALEGVIDMVDDLHFQLNANTEDFK